MVEKQHHDDWLCAQRERDRAQQERGPCKSNAKWALLEAFQSSTLQQLQHLSCCHPTGCIWVQQAAKQLGEGAQILPAALGRQALSASVQHRQQLCGISGAVWIE